MYRILFIFFLLLLKSQGQKSIKAYSNFQFHKSQELPRHFDDRTNSGFRYTGLTFAYRKISTNGLLVQIEPKLIYQNKSDQYERLETGIRFEIGGAIKKPIFKILHVRIGKFVRAFYLNEQIEAGIIRAGSFPTRNNIGGFAFGPFIAFEVKLGKRFYIEANAAYTGVSIYVDYSYREDPRLTEQQRRIGGFDLDSYSERFFRLGFGMNL
ncbi:MAG: hypothetical protein AB8F74_05465 [Saprospiraceae bacterium]